MSETKKPIDGKPKKNKPKKKDEKRLTLDFDFATLDQGIFETRGRSQSKIVEGILKETSDLNDRLETPLDIEIPEKKTKTRTRTNSLSLWDNKSKTKNAKDSKNAETTEDKNESTSSISKK